MNLSFFHMIQGVIIIMPGAAKSMGRPTVAEIDLGALAFNYRQIQRRIPKGVKMLGVVKADAYGHGALPISRKLEQLGVEYLGVAMSEEGVHSEARWSKDAHPRSRWNLPGRRRLDLSISPNPGRFSKRVLATPCPRGGEAEKEGEGSLEGGYRNGKAGGSSPPVAGLPGGSQTISKG